MKRYQTFDVLFFLPTQEIFIIALALRYYMFNFLYRFSIKIKYRSVSILCTYFDTEVCFNDRIFNQYNNIRVYIRTFV